MSVIKLTKCCRFLSGGTPTKSKQDFWTGTVPWFSPKDIKSFDLLDSKDHISEEAISASATQQVAPGTILVVGRSGVLAHTLPVGVLRQSAAFNQDIKAVIPSEEFDPEFIALFIKAQESYVLSAGVKVGATVHSLRAGFIESLEMPKLGLDEQRRIAAQLKAQLAAVEQARQAAQKQVNEIRQLKTHALTTVLGGIPNALPIGAVAKVQSGFAFKSHEFRNHGVRLLRNTNILPGRVYWNDAACLPPEGVNKYSAYALTKGDVLISLDRPIISSGIKVARVASTDLPALLVQRVGRFQIDPSLINPDYLYAFVQTQTFIDSVSGHEQSLGVPHVSPRQIESIAIPLPNLTEQERLAKTLNSIITSCHAAQIAAEAKVCDIELLSSRLLAKVFEEN